VQPDLTIVEAKLKQGLGITPTFATEARSSSASVWRFLEFPRPEGFSIRLLEQLGVFRCVLSIDSFGSKYLAALNLVTASRWKEFAFASEKFLEIGVEFEFLMNEDPFNYVEPPEEIWEFSILGRFVRPSQPETDAAFLLKAITEIFADLVTSGMGWVQEDFRVEGAKHSRNATFYERSPVNRRLAIEIHGVTCAVCEFNFEEFYGPQGEGVVEIHHKTPVHLMKNVAVVDPRTDLVPLCSNCHTMVHRRDPPIKIEDLKQLTVDSTT